VEISYTQLSDHRVSFDTGLPILAYHHVGPRPRGVQWRSLYVSARLFSKQLAELARAGYSTASLSEPRPVVGNAGKKFVVTFDDGYIDVVENALQPLARHGFRAILFLVPGQLGGCNAWDVKDGEVPSPLVDASHVAAWLAAGHEIGAHTVSHPRLTGLSWQKLREEVVDSRKRLEDQFNVPIRHFCYPYGDQNEAVRASVAEAGYQTACTLEPGVNLAATPDHALKRFGARYAKRSPRALFRRLKRWFGLDR
jgi:peptidoglycan/xylan/chitin deacetylase (PgdA/CDA1 family)